MSFFYIYRRSRYGPKRSLFRTMLLILFLLGLGLLIRNILSWPWETARPAAEGVLTEAEPSNWWSALNPDILKQILRQGMPILAMTGEDLPKKGSAPVRLFQALTRIDVSDPKTLLNSQLAMMDTAAAAQPALARAVNTGKVATGDETEDEAEDKAGIQLTIPLVPEDNQLPAASLGQPVPGSPVVFIYNTHNAEAYIPTSGKEKTEGKNGDVTKVATTLATTLQSQYGIKTLRSSVIHDFPSYPQSYANSEKTVKAALADNPGLQVVIDAHRDAGLAEREVVTINGKPVAKILIIVGSNDRLDHPRWQKNQAFAQQVAAKMEKLYPGLLKGVRQQEGRYNQHLHDRSILVEFGSANNSLEEAQRAAELFAKVMAEVLKGMGIPGAV